MSIVLFQLNNGVRFFPTYAYSSSGTKMDKLLTPNLSKPENSQVVELLSTFFSFKKKVDSKEMSGSDLAYFFERLAELSLFEAYQHISVLMAPEPREDGDIFLIYEELNNPRVKSRLYRYNEMLKNFISPNSDRLISDLDYVNLRTFLISLAIHYQLSKKSEYGKMCFELFKACGGNDLDEAHITTSEVIPDAHSAYPTHFKKTDDLIQALNNITENKFQDKDNPLLQQAFIKIIIHSLIRTQQQGVLKKIENIEKLDGVINKFQEYLANKTEEFDTELIQNSIKLLQQFGIQNIENFTIEQIPPKKK